MKNSDTILHDVPDQISKDLFNKMKKDIDFR